MIVSRAYLEAYKSNRLRQHLLKATQIKEIVDFGDFEAFSDASITTSIITMRKVDEPKGIVTVRRLKTTDSAANDVERALKNRGETGLFEIIEVPQENLGQGSWNFATDDIRETYEKIDGQHSRLGELFLIGQGMQTGRNKVFGGLDKAAAASLSLGRKWSRKRAANSDIQRYRIRDRNEYLLWTEDAVRITDLPEPAQVYLTEHRRELRRRAAYRRGNCEWWKFTWPLHKEFYAQDKIVSPFLSRHNRFALDTSREFIGLTDTIVLFKNKNTAEDINYFLALLNSKLLDFRFKGIAKLKGNGIYEYFWNSVSKLRIARLDLRDPRQRARHDKIVRAVLTG